MCRGLVCALMHFEACLALARCLVLFSVVCACLQALFTAVAAGEFPTVVRRAAQRAAFLVQADFKS